MSGSSESSTGYRRFNNKIPNIPQCALRPRPVYQTLLSIFRGSGSETILLQPRPQATPRLYLAAVEKNRFYLAAVEKNRFYLAVVEKNRFYLAAVEENRFFSIAAR